MQQFVTLKNEYISLREDARIDLFLMPIPSSKSTNHRRYRRFLGLFRRAKPSSPIFTRPYQYLINFPRLPITLPPFVPTFLSSRWNNDDDDDDCEVLSRKPPHNYHRHQQPIHRRIPKRYSDLVGPSSKYPHCLYNRSSANILRRHSLKPLHETIYYFQLSKKKSRDIRDYRDHLAHRMQAAMSSELMHSLDRNFVVGDRRQLLPRAHSLNVGMTRRKKSSFSFIPRVKMNLKKEMATVEETTPDYDEQEAEFVIRTIENENDASEEPIADYDDSKTTNQDPSDDKTMATHSDQGLSSSFIIPQTSANETDEQISTPPIPPPLPDLYSEPKQTIKFRCRTIADDLSSDHKLILKDEEKSDQSQPHYIPVSKELTFRKISQTLSRSHSVFSSISRLNDRTTDPPTHDGLSSSSPTTISIANENDYEHRSSSSKIYREYKKRTTSTTIPTTLTRNQSMLIHPMHTRIGLRSSTSSSSKNENFLDMTLSSKQMNVCVINQLNQHLSTRFSQQEKRDLSTNHKINRSSYDPPPPPPPPLPSELMPENTHRQPNVYDEPTDLQPVNPQLGSSSIPPPPPPLPVGGFRPIISSVTRPSNSQQTSIMTLPREMNNHSSAGTSTVSSNLSDTRILCELRENPLFTRAKQHLEIEPGSNGRRSGRRLNGSTMNLTSPEETNHQPVSYLRLDDCSKKTSNSPIPKQLETIIMLPSELDGLMGQRTKSTNNLNQIKSRSSIKSFNPSPYRQSELELIFQKRAQRSEQNLT